MATTKAIGTGSGGVGSSSTVLQVQMTQLSGQTLALDDAVANAKSPCYTQSGYWASGNNTITVPSTAGGVIIVPSVYSTYSPTLKGVAGDTGIALAKAAPSMLTFAASPPSSFVVNWGGLVKLAVSVTADSTTDKITLTSHGLANGDRVKIGGTTVPGGLDSTVWYYVVSTATNDFQLSLTSGGSAIDITSNGTSVTVTTAHDYKLIWL